MKLQLFDEKVFYYCLHQSFPPWENSPRVKFSFSKGKVVAAISDYEYNSPKLIDRSSLKVNL